MSGLRLGASCSLRPLRSASLALVLIGLSACATTSPAAAPTTTARSAVTPAVTSATSATTRPTTPVTTTTTVPPTTTTTTALPSALQPEADDAAEALISAWVAGNRPTGLTVATVGAVATLYAQSVPSDLVSRGCTSTFTPIVCTYGPPGGASASDPILELNVLDAAKGWYVHTVTVEG